MEAKRTNLGASRSAGRAWHPPRIASCTSAELRAGRLSFVHVWQSFVSTWRRFVHDAEGRAYSVPDTPWAGSTVDEPFSATDREARHPAER